MTKNQYYQALFLSWDVLLQHGVNQLPVSVGRILKQLHIPAVAFSKAEQNRLLIAHHLSIGSDGFALAVGRQRIIYYNDACTPERSRFTLAHELGHILLGHLGQEKLVNREPGQMDNPKEQQANVFASRLLAPACVLNGVGATSVEKIMQLCKISREAATYRAERMNTLGQRQQFFTVEKEREVYKQFEAFIISHRHH